MDGIQAARAALRDMELPKVDPPNQVGINRIKFLIRNILNAANNGLKEFEMYYLVGYHYAVEDYLADLGYAWGDYHRLETWFDDFAKKAFLDNPKTTDDTELRTGCVTIKFTWE